MQVTKSGPFRVKDGCFLWDQWRHLGLGQAYQARCLIEHYVHAVPGIDPVVREETIRGLRHILPAMTEDSFPGILPNVLAGRIANRLELRRAQLLDRRRLRLIACGARDRR